MLLRVLKQNIDAKETRHLVVNYVKWYILYNKKGCIVTIS